MCTDRPARQRRKVSSILGIFWVLMMLSAPAGAANNGLGQTPLMGWTSWSHFKKGINEKVIQGQADAMATRLKAFGYTYLNLDSGWRDYNNWDPNGREIPDPRKFPSGLAALATYVHGKGLNLGIYLHPGMDLGPNSPYELNTPILGSTAHAQDISNMAVWGNTDKTAYKIDLTKPGATEYIQSYANLVASWGIDYIKFDFVGPGGGLVPADNRDEMKQWLMALQNTPPGSRPVWIELSNGLSFAYVADWKMVANGWRIDGDIESGAMGTLTTWNAVARRFVDAPKWASSAGPGGWNDFDALPLGMGDGDGLTVDERQTTMTLWAIGCSPLILGADLTNLDPGDFALITNPEVIAVDQAGRVATPVSNDPALQVWRARNADGSYTVALFNLGATAAMVTATWTAVGVQGPALVRDLFSRKDLGSFDTGFGAMLASHASRLLRVGGDGGRGDGGAPVPDADLTADAGDGVIDASASDALVADAGAAGGSGGTGGSPAADAAVMPQTPSAAKNGCGCRIGAAAPSPMTLLPLTSLGLLLLRPRRRR
jgi:MYXO-CTERM domain-containing protein